METVPYYEKSNDGFFTRIFRESTTEEELKWHFDDENRVVVPTKCQGWQIQIDESLPVDLEIGREYFIPVDVYHRIIKGQGDLEIRLFKLDSTKGPMPQHVRKYSADSVFSDNLSYHLSRSILLHENVFRYGSDAWCDLIQEVRELAEKDVLELDDSEIEFLDDDPGRIFYDGERKVVLNTPMRNAEGNGFEFFVDVVNENGSVERVFFN